MTDLPKGPLLRLLENDGISLPGRGEERQIKCFNPHHRDDVPSMRVNVLKEVYHCYLCDISGNAWSYLTEIRGYSKKNAADMLKGMGWTSETLRHAQAQRAKAGEENAGLAKWTKEPYPTVGGFKGIPRAKCIAQHEYRRADGHLICVRYRYEKLHPKNPKCLSFTPASAKGGWWVTAPHKESIPPEDRHAGKLPLYRLPELARAIEETPDRQIWIVEGEKCVDAVLARKDAPGGSPPPTTCLFGGLHNQPNKSDLTPLKGCKVLLIADTDNKGRNAMIAVARALKKLGCKIRLCLPEGEGGYDVAKALGEGGYPAMVQWVQQAGINPFEDVEAQDNRVETAEVLESLGENVGELGENDHFAVLGMSQQQVVFRVNETRELIQLPVQSLDNRLWLLRLAPLEWWLALVAPKGFSSNTRMIIADGILRIAAANGLIDLSDMVVGRGAFRDGEKCYFNTGHDVLSEDAFGRLTHKIDFTSLKQIVRPGAKITFERHQRGAEWGQEFFDTLMRYRWRTINDGYIFLGWVVTSLIGGALPHRPAVWIVAKAGSGKTFLSDPVLKRLMGNALSIEENATEAGIAEKMLDHSLPVWIDEFEPKRGFEMRYLQILDLIRQSTSGSGQRSRGGAAKSINASARFSVIVTSIHQAHLGDVDQSRFAMVSLDPVGLEPEEGAALEQDILATITEERASAIRAHVIENTPEIVKRAAEWRAIYQKNRDLGQRAILIYSALAAGASFLARKDIAIKSVTRETHDQWLPLEVLLTTPLPSPLSPRKSLSLRDALALVIEDDPNDLERTQKVREFCSRHGVKWHRESGTVLFAYTSNSLRCVLSDTEHRAINLAQYLNGLSISRRVSLRLKVCNQRLRSVGIKLTHLQEMGLLPYDGETYANRLNPCVPTYGRQLSATPRAA